MMKKKEEEEKFCIYRVGNGVTTKCVTDSIVIARERKHKVQKMIERKMGLVRNIFQPRVHKAKW